MKSIKTPYLVFAIVIILFGAFFVINSSDSGNQENSNNNTSNTESSKKEQPGQNEVYISDFAFNPSKITVKKGTTVKWTNKDDARHDVTPDKDSKENFTASELMARDESYSYTFEKAGVYSYHCSPHPYMKATIEVTD